MEHSRKGIGAVLKQLRLRTGMTQREVANQLGRRQQIIGHWETGYSQPDLETFFRLCTLYGADISTDFGCNDDMEWGFTAEDRELVAAYRQVTTEERELIDMILKKYKDGTPLSLLNALYAASVDRWAPKNEND